MTKRLSMKLLWKLLNLYFRSGADPRTLRIDKIQDFLNFVEKEIKSNKKL